MSSSENLLNFEPWMYRSTFADSWISEAFARDTEILTQALQKSLSDNSQFLKSDPTIAAAAEISPFINIVNPSVSSDPETTPSHRRSVPLPINGGAKISKRKSRASKKKQSMTTFIAADPANFRRMVQQVTGIRNVPVVAGGIFKPEPQRIGARVQGCLPTVDTSSTFMSDCYGEPEMSSSAVGGEGHVSFTAANVVAGDGGGAGLGYDAFSNFPTLESWKVM